MQSKTRRAIDYGLPWLLRISIIDHFAYQILIESDILSPCGEDCNECEYHRGVKKPGCTGCSQVKGIPFWGACKTYACVTSRGAKHCGVCAEYPCLHLVEQYDPSHPDGQRDAVYRTGLLAFRAKHGDAAVLELMKKTAKKH